MGPMSYVLFIKEIEKGPYMQQGPEWGIEKAPRAPVDNVEGPQYATGALMGKRPLGPIGKIEEPLYATGPTL